MGIDPVIANPANGGLGMEIRIDQPAQLGADRLVNAYSVACSGMYQPLCWILVQQLPLILFAGQR